MPQKPYGLKPQGVQILPEQGGLRAAFSSKVKRLQVDERMIEESFSCAFDGRTVQVQSDGQGHHALHIAGLDLEQEQRVRMVMNMVHIFHLDGDVCPDACLSLDWHMDPESGNPPSNATKIGRLRNLAKRARPDHEAANDVAEMMYDAVQAHSGLSNAYSIVAPPSGFGFAAWLAQTLGYWMNIPVLGAEDTGRFRANEKLLNWVCSSRNYASVGRTRSVCRPLVFPVACWIVDDIYGSGGTIRALTSHLRALGAERILALTVTKTLTNCRQT